MSDAGLSIVSVTRFDREELLSRLRVTPLRGFDHAHPYAEATIELAPAIDTDTLTPAQRYVLAPTVQRLLAMRAALLAPPLPLSGSRRRSACGAACQSAADW